MVVQNSCDAKIVWYNSVIYSYKTKKPLALCERLRLLSEDTKFKKTMQKGNKNSYFKNGFYLK